MRVTKPPRRNTHRKKRAPVATVAIEAGARPPGARSRTMLLVVVLIGVACACDTARTGPDREPCNAYVALLKRCGGEEVASRATASLEASMLDPVRAKQTVARCAAQRERLARSCR